MKNLYKHPYYKLMDWKSKHGVGKARYVMTGDESPENSFVDLEDELKKLKVILFQKNKIINNFYRITKIKYPNLINIL